MDSAPPPIAGPHAPVPGPVDRVSFFEEQARRRRQTWRYTLLCAVAAALGGMPLAMFLSPLVYLVLVLVLRHLPAPESVWEDLRGIARVIPTFFDALGNVPDMGPLDTLKYVVHTAARLDYPFGSGWLTLLALVGPGMALTLLVWLFYHAVFRRAGVGGMLLRLGARPPLALDLEEHQLANLVEEMAIASGLPAPQVRLLDSPVPNAVAVGSRPENAVIIVTRGLLDTLDRDETQGIIAHVMASVGNGDLRIARSVTTVFQAVELIFTGFDALFNLSGSAWRDLFRVARCALTLGMDRRAAEVVAQLMEHRVGEFREDGVMGVLEDAGLSHPRTWRGKLVKRLPFLYVVFFPFLLLYLLAIFLRMQVWLVRFTVVGPLLMGVLRTRRYLADATAVQLTRNPDGLARGLARLAMEGGGTVPGGQWFSHLFVVGAEGAHLRRSVAPGSEGKSYTGEVSLGKSHPTIAQRLQRLEAQGSSVSVARLTEQARARFATRYREQIEAVRARTPRRHRAGAGAVMLLVAPLLAVAGVLAVFAFSAIFMFGVTAAVFFSAAAMGLLLPLMR